MLQCEPLRVICVGLTCLCDVCVCSGRLYAAHQCSDQQRRGARLQNSHTLGADEIGPEGAARCEFNSHVLLSLSALTPAMHVHCTVLCVCEALWLACSNCVKCVQIICTELVFLNTQLNSKMVWKHLCTFTPSRVKARVYEYALICKLEQQSWVTFVVIAAVSQYNHHCIITVL